MGQNNESVDARTNALLRSLLEKHPELNILQGSDEHGLMSPRTKIMLTIPVTHEEIIWHDNHFDELRRIAFEDFLEACPVGVRANWEDAVSDLDFSKTAVVQDHLDEILSDIGDEGLITTELIELASDAGDWLKAKPVSNQILFHGHGWELPLVAGTVDEVTELRAMLQASMFAIAAEYQRRVAERKGWSLNPSSGNYSPPEELENRFDESLAFDRPETEQAQKAMQLLRAYLCPPSKEDRTFPKATTGWRMDDTDTFMSSALDPDPEIIDIANHDSDLGD